MTGKTRRTPAGSLAGEREELALLELVAGGDRGAFSELYRAYYPRLQTYLMRMTGSPELVEEVLDDVMMVVWRKAPAFESRSRVSTWIFGIAYRQALRALRKLRRTRSVEDELKGDAPAAGDSPERDLDRRQRATRLRAALGELSAEHRAVVELTYDHGLSYPEIARLVGCPLGTVKTRMYHARRHLRRLLPELERDEG